MQILYYFEEHQTSMYQWQRFHIFDELERHDCHITVFNPLEYTTMEEANEKLISYIDKNIFDLFMTPHGSEVLFIETLLKIKQKGLPTLLICFDSLMSPLKHKKIARYFDLVLLSQQDRNGMFKSFNCNFISSPYAANPYLFKQKYKQNIPKVCFIGTPYGSRVNKLNVLLEHEVPLDLYANSTKNKINDQAIHYLEKLKVIIDLNRFEVGRRVFQGAIKQKFNPSQKLRVDSTLLNRKPAVDLAKMNDLFSNYDLSLSISEARNTGVLSNPVNIVHLRNFEIPMSGGLQICSYFDELAEYFEEDEEIIFYRTEEEFVQKTRFYLKPENENIRIKMKQAARKRAENDHTWFCRFKKAFDYFGLEYK